MDPVEQPLHGGVANAGAVTRVGDHVLRPSSPFTPAVHRFLTDLRGSGFDGASVPVGVDADGRERLGWIDGNVAIPPYPAWVQTDASLASMTSLMRRFHQASATIDAGGATFSSEIADPQGGTVVCHNDVCLENVVFREGEAVGLLDFDYAAPGRPVFDLAQFSRMCIPIDDDQSAVQLGWVPNDGPARLRLVADTYGLDAVGRSQLVAEVGAAVERGGEFVRRRAEAGDPGFVMMWEFIGGMERFDRRRRWWSEASERFIDALR
jgi:hypothetical protein